VSEPLTYVVARIHEAMISDERLHEQAIDVVIIGERLELRGEVATPERRTALVALARELAPNVEVIDDLCVSATSPRPEPEQL
jgi:hypothetical protein